MLDRGDFQLIKTDPNPLQKWRLSLLIAAMIQSVTLVATYLEKALETSSKSSAAPILPFFYYFKLWQYLVPAGFFAIIIIIYVIELLVPSERKRLVQSIDEHFQAAKPRLMVQGEESNDTSSKL